jgi:hypothetical protein
MASLTGAVPRLTGAAVAFLLAFAGTEALKRPAARPWGVCLIVSGAVLAAFRIDELRPLAPGPVRTSMSGARARYGGAAFALSALLVVWADVRRVQGPLTFGLTEALWAVAIALFAASTWALSPPAERRAKTPVSAVEIALLAAVVAVGLAARTVLLREVPFAIHGDEIITGTVARLHFLPWRGTTLFRTVWKDIDLPALWFAIVAGSLKVLGSTLEAVRLPAALFGAATLVPFWALARGLYGRRAALLATLLLACGTVHVHFSRVTLNNITASFFWTLCFALLLHALRSGRPFAWAMAGLTGGLGEHFYYGTRLLPFILALFFAHLWVTERRGARRRLPSFALVVFGYLVGFGPLLVCFLRSPGLYLGRGMGVAVWSPVMNPAGGAGIARTFARRLYTNFLGIGALPSDDTVYFAPLLSVAEAALFWLGLAMLLRRWRDPAAFLLVASTLATVLVGGTLIPPAPAMNHWAPAFAVFYAIAAAPLAGWLQEGDRLGASGRLAVGGAALAGVFAIAVSSLDFYFHRYYAIRPEFEIGAAQTRMQAALGPNYLVFTVGDTWQPLEAERNSYLVSGQSGARLRDPARQLPLTRVHGRGLAFFFFDDTLAWLPRVRALYPCGAETPVTSRGGAPFFTTWVLTPLQARRCSPAPSPSGSR